MENILRLFGVRWDQLPHSSSIHPLQGLHWAEALQVLTDRESAAAALLATNRAAYTEVGLPSILTNQNRSIARPYMSSLVACWMSDVGQRLDMFLKHVLFFWQFWAVQNLTMPYNTRISQAAVRLLCTLPHAEPKTSTTLVAACGKMIAWRIALEAKKITDIQHDDPC